ncbi:hypothetical protein L9W92_16810 [Pelotomaculum terephthalicicum JT]|uniref:LolA family protein n=1 Tax=Pelotomaculum TaxID=191373 RepID=UPI0009CAF126|nr:MULTISPECIES: hypothetical protein [Pelotomaculum]MCG9969666.1 hypothetical protein [Pelotomaculum terephthalicicum JT]OPX92188.1 MAG: hypothetical protein A4E54_00075 [Pelotomaculum sp. PtaB.Bin117]
MKRCLSFLLSLVFILSCLIMAGCGGNKKENGSQPTSQQTAANEESAASLFAKGKKIEGLSFDYSMTSKDAVMSGKMWIEGEKVKSESTAEGKKTITIIDGSAFYTYYPDENTAMKMALEKQDNQQSVNPFEYSADVDTAPDKYEILETTVYDGVKCKVIAVTSADGKETTKMWVREDYGIPVRLEVTGADGNKMVIEYKNMTVGKQPANTFQLPAGVAVTDMSEMLNNLPKVPGAGQ